MKLEKKKELAARTFNVGKKRIVFAESRVNEIKEAITKQDMRDLRIEGAITIKNIKGKRKNVKRTGRRGPGKIKKRVAGRKKEYITITRRLRNYVAILKSGGEISKDDFYDIRKKIRNRIFKSRADLKDYIKNLKHKQNENTKKTKTSK